MYSHLHKHGQQQRHRRQQQYNTTKQKVTCAVLQKVQFCENMPCKLISCLQGVNAFRKRKKFENHTTCNNNCVGSGGNGCCRGRCGGGLGLIPLVLHTLYYQQQQQPLTNKLLAGTKTMKQRIRRDKIHGRSCNSEKVEKVSLFREEIPIYFGSMRKWVAGISENTSASDVIKAILKESKISMKHLDSYRLLLTSLEHSTVLTKYEQEITPMAQLASQHERPTFELIKVPNAARLSAEKLRKKIVQQNYILEMQSRKISELERCVLHYKKNKTSSNAKCEFCEYDEPIVKTLEEMLNQADDEADRLKAESESLTIAQNALDKLIELRKKQLSRLYSVSSNDACSVKTASSEDTDTGVGSMNSSCEIDDEAVYVDMKRETLV